MTAQHHKGKKRPRRWHRGWRDGKRWLGHVENIESHVRGLEKKLRKSA